MLVCLSTGIVVYYIHQTLSTRPDKTRQGNGREKLDRITISNQSSARARALAHSLTHSLTHSLIDHPVVFYVRRDSCAPARAFGKHSFLCCDRRLVPVTPRHSTIAVTHRRHGAGLCLVDRSSSAAMAPAACLSSSSGKKVAQMQ